MVLWCMMANNKETTTIEVKKSTQKKLMLFKIKKEFTSINDVILFLMKNLKEVKKNEVI